MNEWQMAKPTEPGYYWRSILMMSSKWSLPTMHQIEADEDGELVYVTDIGVDDEPDYLDDTREICQWLRIEQPKPPS